MIGATLSPLMRTASRLTLGAVAAGISLTSTAQSQSDDPVLQDLTAAIAPFLGTWSGVFTTQDHEFWQVEDYVCFPGCPPGVRARMTALLDDPANDELPVSALMGQATGYAAEHLAGSLTPLGLEIQQANDPLSDPKMRCEPYGFVREVTNPLPMRMRQDGEQLVILYEEWSLLRTIHMDGRPHPELQTPSLLGHSVGRIEDGELIVETTAINPGWISDFSRGGHSGELTAVERYRVAENPRRLELELTLEDPVTLTEPYTIIKTWLYTPEVELLIDRCGELPTKY
jgi:hypothetical protein